MRAYRRFLRTFGAHFCRKFFAKVLDGRQNPLTQSAYLRRTIAYTSILRETCVILCKWLLWSIGVASIPSQLISLPQNGHLYLAPCTRRNLPDWPAAEQAAEKVEIWLKSTVARPSGAKAPLILLTLAARLKSCPVTKPEQRSFSAACEAAFLSRLISGI